MRVPPHLGQAWPMQDRDIVKVQASRGGSKDGHLRYSNVLRVLHSLQKQDMTSHWCTAAADVMSAHPSSMGAWSPASSSCPCTLSRLLLTRWLIQTAEQAERGSPFCQIWL